MLIKVKQYCVFFRKHSTFVFLLILFVVFNVVLVEFNAMCNLVNADAFVGGVHCGKLLVAHLNRAEAQAVVCNCLVVAAVCTACHKVGDNTCIGVALVKTLLKVAEFLAVKVNAVGCTSCVDNLKLKVVLVGILLKHSK